MKKSKIWTVQNMARIAIIMALYAGITIALTPISYGNVQIRVAECLLLLCFYNPIYGIGITLGCLVANIFSPLGYIDMIFGTLATVIAVLGLRFCKNIWVAAGIGVVANAIIVGIELSIFYQLPFIATALEVGLGEVIAIYGLGFPVLRALKDTPFFKSLVNQK